MLTELQPRMRNATILMIRLRGVATEAIKNIVLAGIGKLILADGDSVSEQDLGAGFFFRDEDVGKNVSLRRFLILLLHICALAEHIFTSMKPESTRRRSGRVCFHFMQD